MSPISSTARPSPRRPVTFVFNGGPGASSVWLHLGALGPWRLPMKDGTINASAAPALVDNEEEIESDQEQ